MATTDLITILQVSIGILITIMIGLIVAYSLVDNKKNNSKQDSKILIDSNEESIKNKSKEQLKNYGRFQGELTQESIYNFMEFDEIKDGMIIRKNRIQYVMVLQCNGVNYDLMSEPEKIAVEEGFVQFLNTLRFPIQLYVQSRTLNLKDILEEYNGRIASLQNDIQKLNMKIADAKKMGNRALLEKLEFEMKRKNNVLEYGMDITDYVDRMSSNRNILQQKTFVIVSFYSAELGGNIENYSKDELDSMCFTELYTRCQNIASALANSQISSSILDSEELSELLYIAYNRDESELLQFAKILDSQYDSLYSTSRDVYEKQKAMIEDQINIDAVELATDSLMKADRMKQQQDWAEAEKKEKVKVKAKELLEEYEDRLDNRVFEMAIENVDKLAEEKYKEKKSPVRKATEETEIRKKVIKKKKVE